MTAAYTNKGDKGALWSLTGPHLTSLKCPVTGIVWLASTSFSQPNCFVLFCHDVLVCVRDLDIVPLRYYYICVTITGEAFYPCCKSSSCWQTNWTLQLLFATSVCRQNELNCPWVVCNYSFVRLRTVSGRGRNDPTQMPWEWRRDPNCSTLKPNLSYITETKTKQLSSDFKDKNMWRKTVNDHHVTLLPKAAELLPIQAFITTYGLKLFTAAAMSTVALGSSSRCTNVTVYWVETYAACHE